MPLTDQETVLILVPATCALNGLLEPICTVAVAGLMVTVTISPATATVQIGSSSPLSAQVAGTKIKTVSWSVNGMAGGNATVGTINNSGRYMAPANPPPGF